MRTLVRINFNGVFIGVFIGVLLFQTTAVVHAQRRSRVPPGPPTWQNVPTVPPDGELAAKLSIDPRYSYVGALVQRDDVRQELQLTDTQLTALQPVKADYQTFETHHINIEACGQFIVDPQEAAQAFGPEKIRTRPDGATYHYRDNFDSHKPPILIARDEPTAEVKVQIQQQLKAEDPTAKVMALLTPAQRQRLRELDLRWRGPLALEDVVVADRLKLGSDQRAKIAVIAAGYRDGYWRGAHDLRKRQQGVATANGVMVGSGMDAETFARMRNELISMTNELLRSCLIRRTAAEANALTVLSPDQAKQWPVLLGAAFTFTKPPQPQPK